VPRQKRLDEASLRILRECKDFDVYVGPENLIEAADLAKRSFVDPYDDYEGCRIKITAAGKTFLNSTKEKNQ
jgi:hypothetical protein